MFNLSNLFNRKDPSDSQPQAESIVTGLIKIPGCDDPGRRADIIFVHGLGGHHYNTWHPKENLSLMGKQQVLDEKKSWLYWLGNDLKNVGVWTFSYEANFTKWKGSAMSRFDQAKNLLKELENKRIGTERPVFFITHSLGGLLVKHALLLAPEFDKYKELIKNSKGIVFLATPHNGSHLANTVGLLSHVFRTTISVEELTANNPWLRQLNTTYRQRLGQEENSLKIATEVYYETKDTLNYRVVDEGSADPGLFNVMTNPVNADHIQIAKPKSPDDFVYEGIKNFIEGLLDQQKALPPAKTNPFPELNSSSEVTTQTEKTPDDSTQNTSKIADSIGQIGILNSNSNIENQNNNFNF